MKVSLSDKLSSLTSRRKNLFILDCLTCNKVVRRDLHVRDAFMTCDVNNTIQKLNADLISDKKVMNTICLFILCSVWLPRRSSLFKVFVNESSGKIPHLAPRWVISRG